MIASIRVWSIAGWIAALGRAGDAVIGPKHLIPIGHFDVVVWLLAGMGAGERGMVRGVPVLGRERVIETPEQPVDTGMMASPSATGSSPPGMKVGWTSISPRMSVTGSACIWFLSVQGGILQLVSPDWAGLTRISRSKSV